MFVSELDRSVVFYRELLALEVSVRDETAALLRHTRCIRASG